MVLRKLISVAGGSGSLILSRLSKEHKLIGERVERGTFATGSGPHN